MNKNTQSDDLTLDSWVDFLSQCWLSCAKDSFEPTSQALAQAVAQRLQISPQLAFGLVQGINSLFLYAKAERISELSAIDEERNALKAAFEAVCPILEARLQARLDELDLQADVAICPTCLEVAPSQGRRARSWQSSVGTLHLKRRYCWCEKCEAGVSQSQLKIGLPPSDYTANFEQIATLMATTIPHQLAVDTLREVLTLQVSKTALEAMTQRRASEVVTLLDEEAKEVESFQKSWLKSPPWLEKEEKEKEIEVAYLEIDGVSVMVREELETDKQGVEGRGGKGRKYNLSGREVKNAVLYDGNQCVKESETRGAILEKRYVSHLGDWIFFSLLLWVEIMRMGLDKTKRLVVLSDGAAWIRSVCESLPVEVFLILDLYHVKKRIWEVAEAMYGERGEQTREWANYQCQKVEEGEALKVIEELKYQKGSQTKAREKIESLEQYLRNNIDRMEYARYREMGLRVGSGTVESANYHVTGARLKLQGMRWSEEGAGQMARLRADLFNGRWQQRTRQILKAA